MRVFWTCVLMAVAAIGRAEGTVLLPVEFTEMVAASPLIVRARVIGTRAQTTSGRRAIETIVTARVLDAIKGQPGSSIAFRVPNGEIGRYRRITVGAPSFAVGEEIVVFLAGHPPAIPMPFGLSQGVYRVAAGAGGRLVVMQPIVAGDTPAARRVVRGDPARRSLTLADFVQRVRQAGMAR